MNFSGTICKFTIVPDHTTIKTGFDAFLVKMNIVLRDIGQAVLKLLAIVFTAVAEKAYHKD